MKCKKLTIISGMFLSGFLAFLSFLPCHALSNYDYSFNSPFNNSTTKMYERNGNNPFNFVPKFALINITYTGSVDCSTTTSNNFITINLQFEDSAVGTKTAGSVSTRNYCSSTSTIINIEQATSYSRFSYLMLGNFTQSDYTVQVTLYDDFPFSSGGITPEGELDITQNGQYDVTNYAQVNVDVPQISEGQYHDDLAQIKQAILIGSATLLVLYFFYCIYRIIISYGGSR